MHDEHGIRCLAVVHVAEPATDAPDLWRQLHFAHEPARDVHLVDALISQIAVACVPDPVPIIVQFLPHERLDWRGAKPKVAVDSGGPRLFAVHLPDACAALVAGAAGPQQFAEVAGLRPCDGLMKSNRRTALRAALHDASVFLRRFSEDAAFEHIVRNRLLDVGILARLTRPDAEECVPVVWRRGGNGVDFLRLQHLSRVHERLHVLILLRELVLAFGENRFVDVAKCADFYAVLLEQIADVRLSATSEADDAHTDFAVR